MRTALDVLPAPSAQILTPVMKGFDLTEGQITNAWQRDLPINLSLYLGAQCNLRCIYCMTAAGSPTASNLSLEEYQSVIDQAFELGIRQVMFAGKGEPLLDQNLWALLEYVQIKGGWNMLFTNATTITPVMASRLWQLDCSVMTKVNSFNPQVQDALAGILGAAEKMYVGVRNLMDVGFNRPTPTRMANDNLICRQNHREIPQMIEYFSRHNVQNVLESILLAGRAVENRKLLELDSSQLAWLRSALTSRRLGYVQGVNFYGEGCITETTTILVTEQGEVMPCWGREGLTVGNIKNQSLKALWFTPSMVESRRHCRRHIGMVRAGTTAPRECPGRCYAKRILKGGRNE